jgi:hypothetical protein
VGVLLRLERAFAETAKMTDFYLNVGDEVVQDRLVTEQPLRPSPTPRSGNKLSTLCAHVAASATSSKKTAWPRFRYRMV